MAKPLEWKTEQRKVNDLIPLEINPRKISEAKRMKMIESLQKFNLVDIPVVDKNGTVISGHQRLKALQAIGRGDEMVDVRIPNRALTQKEIKEYNLLANTHFGEFDFDIIETDFADVDMDELGVSLPDLTLGTEAEEEKRAPLEAKEDDYEVPEEDKIKTDIKPGDLFEIGEHRLLCGDSTDIEQVEKLMGGVFADMVVTDPPYNVDYTGKTKDALKIENDKKTNSDFYQFLFDAFSAMCQFTKVGGAWYVWHADSECANFRSAMNDVGVKVRQCLVWVKNAMVMGRQDYHWKHEPCLYGWKDGAAHNWCSDRKQTTVLQYDRPLRNGEHPTMKPIPLIAYQIGNNSKPGEIVLDTFLGSGSTMVASDQLNRKCYGMELDPKYCQVIVDRMLKLNPNIEIKRNGEIYNQGDMK